MTGVLLTRDDGVIPVEQGVPVNAEIVQAVEQLLGKLDLPHDPWPCCHDGCTNPAAYAIRFHNQAGHVHDCSPCTAELREWTDVAEVVPLPCPFPHGNGETWTDTPRELK